MHLPTSLPTIPSVDDTAEGHWEIVVNDWQQRERERSFADMVTLSHSWLLWHSHEETDEETDNVEPATSFWQVQPH
jgi:hypothetical protein